MIANSPDAKPMVINSDEAELEINEKVAVIKINPRLEWLLSLLKVFATIPELQFLVKLIPQNHERRRTTGIYSRGVK